MVCQACAYGSPEFISLALHIALLRDHPLRAESTDLGTCLAVQCYAGEHVIWS